MSEPESSAPAEAPPPAKGGNPLIPLIAVLILVPVICYALVEFVFMPRLLAAAGQVAESQPDANARTSPGGSRETTVDFGRSMVSLAGSGGSRYLRVNMVLAGANPRIPELVTSNEIALRDAAITVLSSMSLSQIEGADGRDIVRRALLSRLNGIMGEDVFQQIYFTEFVIQ
jgi:flagellar FliL protein